MSKDPEVITVTELRNMTREIIENAHFRGRQYVVERVGQPMVVIIGIEEYQLLAQRTLTACNGTYTSHLRPS